MTSTGLRRSSHLTMELRRAPYLLFVALAAVMAVAQAGDSHSSGPFAITVESSAFLHGYLHGYEAGFHDGDIDFQMGRDADMRRWAHDSDGYRSSFGERAIFRRGYRQGFSVAYADALAGRPFRAVAGLRELQASLPATSGRKSIDAAVTDGYQRGLRKGLEDARAGHAFAALVGECRSAAGSAGYCSVFDSGFRLGYGDGYTNQRSVPAMTTTASK